MVGHGEVWMKFTLFERLTGFVICSKNRNPCIKGPQPRIITIEQAKVIERFQKENEEAAENEVAR